MAKSNSDDFSGWVDRKKVYPLYANEAGKLVKDKHIELFTHQPFLPIEFYVGAGKTPVCLDCIVDTGSSISILPREFAKKTGIPIGSLHGFSTPRYINLSTPAGNYCGTLCDLKFRVATGDADSKFHACRCAHANINAGKPDKLKRFMISCASYVTSAFSNTESVQARVSSEYGILAYQDLVRHYHVDLSSYEFRVCSLKTQELDISANPPPPHHLGIGQAKSKDAKLRPRESR